MRREMRSKRRVMGSRREKKRELKSRRREMTRKMSKRREMSNIRGGRCGRGKEKTFQRKTLQSLDKINLISIGFCYGAAPFVAKPVTDLSFMY